MATMTTQDRFVLQKANEVLTFIQSYKALADKLVADKGKARGAQDEDLYNQMADNLSKMANMMQRGGTWGAAQSIITNATNRRAFGR